MLKFTVLTVFTFLISYSYSQIAVDSITIKSESADSIEIETYTSLPGCYNNDSIVYQNQSDSLIVSFFYSEKFPQCECITCQRHDVFKIKKDTYNKLIFNGLTRYCINNCVNYSNYKLSAKGSLLFSSVDIITINNNKEVNFIYSYENNDLKFINTHLSNFKIRIYDIMSIIVIEKIITNSETIHVSHLKSGIYLIELDNKYIYKFIKY